MLMVKALAGTGKTTTGMFGLGVKKPPKMQLSDEQKDIIKLMRTFKWQNCAAQAYNTTIAKELEQRVPPGVTAATSNAFGHRAWAAFTGTRLKVDGRKSRMLFRDMVQGMPWKEANSLEGPVDQLVALCKNYLMEPTSENLIWLCDRFDIEENAAVFDYVDRVFKKGLEDKSFIDFNDQNFLPIYFDIAIPKFDLVLVDEVQDLPKAKQELAFRMARGPIVAIGDEHQAIYGFSGADADAMNSMWDRFKDKSKDAKMLPLTITRRCPKAVVALANKYVPELKAHDEAPEGIVRHVSEKEHIANLIKDELGHMVLCRMNAPLTSVAFKLIAANRRCFIQGKDIGQGIKREIEKTKEYDLKKAIAKVHEAIEKKLMDLSRKPFPDENKVTALNDRMSCIYILAEGLDSVSDFCGKVDSLFKDSGSPSDIQLCSVHKSKGLEHPRVTILKPSKLPLIMNKKGKKTPTFQVQQEKNLAYVAYTRAMHTLTIADEDKENDKDLSVGSDFEGEME